MGDMKMKKYIVAKTLIDGKNNEQLKNSS